MILILVTLIVAILILTHRAVSAFKGSEGLSQGLDRVVENALGHGLLGLRPKTRSELLDEGVSRCVLQYSCQRYLERAHLTRTRLIRHLMVSYVSHALETLDV